MLFSHLHPYKITSIIRHSRTLITGSIFIRDLPAHHSHQTLTDAAHKHGHIYGIWISTSPPASTIPLTNSRRKTSRRHRPAAIRITNQPVPATLQEISKLPPHTQEEADQMQRALSDIVRYLGERGVVAVAVPKFPDMFQSGAQKALGLGAGTRLFDKRTTDRPRFTKGLVDGYHDVVEGGGR
ncbi:hypothetical protein BX661DRAFT_225988 [Kickxella alabastrina]|uniref:uncharacterized protein n=1 Tax=Kickxella alabastrina TaxID=61397 RepID=UPI00221E67DE|nr:uncharacterized protein BX661DRAFT_225988 [Kickxella alabastrina]KAI7823957.1 hypothetical protein BX661DRAFT_225988 [Kickxella alabastrina]